MKTIYQSVLSLAVMSSLVLVSSARAEAQEVRSVYGPFAAVEALDLHSTWKALGQSPGAVEANPFARQFIDNKAAAIAIRAGAIAGGIGVSEYLRKRHPRMAFWMLMGVTVTQGVIDYRNYRIAARGRR